MTQGERHILAAPAGYRSREAALFLEQMDDQSRRLEADTRRLTAAELQWQPAPAMNTLGMLLAHLAIVEVYWIQVGPSGLGRPDTAPVLGIKIEDDGIPLAGDGRPPEGLSGRELAFFDDLLARARDHTKRITRDLVDADLDRQFARTRRSGVVDTLNVRWVYYHMLEHYAGHYGQILMLRHWYRSSPRA